jgi:hypothetical protein
MSSRIVKTGYLEYGTSNRSTSYKVEKLIKILINYLPAELVDLILEGLSLDVTMTVLIRNSLIISQNDEIDDKKIDYEEIDYDDTISRKYVVYNHVNTMVAIFIASTPNKFVFNIYGDERTLPADIKDFILAEDPNLLFGDECELYTLSKGVTVCVGEADLLATVYAKRNNVDVSILSIDKTPTRIYLS